MKENETGSRRNFLKTGLALTGSSFIVSKISANGTAKTSLSNEGEGFTFLFQGDSITDGDRSRNNDWNHVMGHGYAFMICGKLGYQFPEKKFHFYNRGISGNKLTELAQRWDEDTLALKPDLLSILIGINDTDAWMNGDTNFTSQQFETRYRALLQKTRWEMPKTELVICEPFILPVGRIKDKWTIYDEEIKKYQAIAKRIAIEFNAIHVPFQQAFDKALNKAAADYWIWDGIHPMPAGHELMALEWLKEVSKKIRFLK